MTGHCVLGVDWRLDPMRNSFGYSHHDYKGANRLLRNLCVMTHMKRKDIYWLYSKSPFQLSETGYTADELQAAVATILLTEKFPNDTQSPNV